jgi:hypothetical protein
VEIKIHPGDNTKEKSTLKKPSKINGLRVVGWKRWNLFYMYSKKINICVYRVYIKIKE